MIAFGPVPSHRFGRSLGVNHIPFKVCSYACVYCQVGPTLQMREKREAFFSTAEIVEAVARKVEACRASGEAIDYISFVPDGEPTLDANLGEHIRALAPFGIPIAVITNASLLWMPEVRADLARADVVSVKVDTTQPGTWRRINRPHGGLELEKVLEGVRAFAHAYPGELISETMLVGSINDGAEGVEGVAAFLASIAPARAYLGVPTRPPVVPDVHPPDDVALVRAYAIMKARLPHVELLPAHEAGTFVGTGDPAEDLLAILAVHPMRETAVRAYLQAAGAGPVLLERLVQDGHVDRVDYQGEAFYVRSFHRTTGSARRG